MADAHHAEWLSLLDISGPFLSPPVLDRVFPQGLDAADSDHTAKLRLAHEEWAEEQRKAHPDPAIHDAWIRFILSETLGLTPEVLLEGEGIPGELEFTPPEHGETIRPDFVVFDPEDEPGTRKPRLLVSVWPADTELDKPVADSRWSASPIDRMIAFCRSEHVGLRLGLVTNGERWALVDAPAGETSAHVSWYANLWGPEPLTLRAFRSLLGLRRFFGVAENDRLDAMLVESANYQTEVTDQLGFQVRRAVEVLVQAIDRADADTDRTLLADTDPARIYEAALTVMMRLVFLFSAEERGLLRLGDPMYDQFYAVSTLHAQLQEAADLVGPEVLERRQDAWSRLLGTFRAIYGGVHHQDLQIIPYGSSLFDPDRFPFLEGRPDDTPWQETDALPLPIDNRTVLLLLRSLQMLDLGKGKGARKLSFRALDIEQIGHIYETLLDHSAYRATEPMVSLQGNQGREPEIPVSKLVDLMLQEVDEQLVEFLKGELKKGVNPIRKALEKGRTPEPEAVARLRRACGGDDILLGKLLPFNELIRLDPWDDPVVIPEGAVFVTAGEDRRSTGTHYTPRALTEEIVQYALEPVVYRGPAEGKDRKEWELKTPDEILDLKVCDPAMGSGAFLVQACRYLSERLVEAWEQSGQASVGPDVADVMPNDPEEKLSLARRLVSDRCLHGVDVNPLAVEMAKLSMWLITLAKDTPFTFLDHVLKCGDSLLGITTLEQLAHFHLDPEQGERLHGDTLFDPNAAISQAIEDAADLRGELESFVVRDTYSAERKAELSRRADRYTSWLRRSADGLLDAALDSPDDLGSALVGAATSILSLPQEEDQGAPRTSQHLHWPLEFPEVFLSSSGAFDAVIGNPPFLGAKYWKGTAGARLRATAKIILRETPGRIDLAVLFHRRAIQLLGRSGISALMGPTSLRSGRSLDLGLARIAEEGEIYRAEPDFAWPGTASVRVCIVWVSAFGAIRPLFLARVEVDEIAPDLSAGSAIKPDRLNEVWGFEGIHNAKGAAFVVDDRDWLERLEAEPSPYLRRYVSADDFASGSGFEPPRRILATGNDDLGAVAVRSPEAFAYLEAVVKPERNPSSLKPYKGLADRWWQFWNHRAESYSRLRESDWCLVIPKIGKFVVAFRLPSSWVHRNSIVLLEEQRPDLHHLLLSAPFDLWARKLSGRMMSGSLKLSLSGAMLTFPLPIAHVASDDLAARWQAKLQELAVGGKAIAEVLASVGDQTVTDGRTQELRHLTEAITSETLAAYGWADLSDVFDYRVTDGQQRFCLGAEPSREVMARLFDLNFARARRSRPDEEPFDARNDAPGPRLGTDQ